MEVLVCQLPFILHIVVESPAVLAFGLFPSSTLTRPQPHAHAVIRQYALLLLSSIIIAAASLVQSGRTLHEPTPAGASTAFAFALYHLGPVARAWARLRTKRNRGSLFVHPVSHLVVHAACAILFALQLAWLI